MWESFTPIEYRGMSIITALVLVGILWRINQVQARVNSMETCMIEIKVLLARLETYSIEHRRDIRELKEKHD